MKNSPPRLLLIGAGHFGRQHLKVIAELQQKALVDLAGVAVNTTASQQSLAKELDVPVYTHIDASRLQGVDAVDIVTPSDTHFDLVSTCLPHCHVLVEKPLATKTDEADRLRRLAEKHRRILMVGHIFRFNPVILALKELASEIGAMPRAIEFSMLNDEKSGIETSAGVSAIRCR